MQSPVTFPTHSSHPPSTSQAQGSRADHPTQQPSSPMAQTSRKPQQRRKKPSKPANAKTELCKNWVRSGECEHGARCFFAHGESELRKENLADVTKRRNVKETSKLRSLLCQKYLMTGACPYNDRCIFRHDSRLECKDAAGVVTRALRPHKPPRGQTAADDEQRAAHGCKDFYWPDLPALRPEDNPSELQAPEAQSLYHLPEEFRSSESMAERGMWSMWEHFLAFLHGVDVRNGVENPFLASGSRLAVFRQLSGATEETEAAPSDEEENAKSARVRASSDVDVEPPTAIRGSQSPITVADLALSDDEDEDDDGRDGDDVDELWHRATVTKPSKPSKPIKPGRKTYSSVAASKPIARPMPRPLVPPGFEFAAPFRHDEERDELRRLIGSVFSEVMLI